MIMLAMTFWTMCFEVIKPNSSQPVELSVPNKNPKKRFFPSVRTTEIQRLYWVACLFSYSYESEEPRSPGAEQPTEAGQPGLDIPMKRSDGHLWKTWLLWQHVSMSPWRCWSCNILWGVWAHHAVPYPGYCGIYHYVRLHSGPV